MKITQPQQFIRATSVPASGTSVLDAGGLFGSPGTLTLEEILALIGTGAAPGAFLTVISGGKGTVYPHGNLGAGAVIDLNLGNYHWGTLDQACTIDFTGWTNLKDCQITVELTEDGTGGWTSTFSGVTWIGGATPTPDTAVGTVTVYVFFSRDGGATIYGALVGGGGSANDSMVPYFIASTETFTVPLYKQALFSMLIDNEGILDVVGFLAMVD